MSKGCAFKTALAPAALLEIGLTFFSSAHPFECEVFRCLLCLMQNDACRMKWHSFEGMLGAVLNGIHAPKSASARRQAVRTELSLSPDQLVIPF